MLTVLSTLMPWGKSACHSGSILFVEPKANMKRYQLLQNMYNHVELSLNQVFFVSNLCLTTAHIDGKIQHKSSNSPYLCCKFILDSLASHKITWWKNSQLERVERLLLFQTIKAIVINTLSTNTNECYCFSPCLFYVITQQIASGTISVSLYVFVQISLISMILPSLSLKNYTYF